jgi:molybdopterin converting factor small subunit
MRVLFYGRLADTIGPELELEVQPGSSVASIREQLANDYPAAASVLTNRRALTCVGGTFVKGDHILATNEEVEFLPPLSGG